MNEYDLRELGRRFGYTVRQITGSQEFRNMTATFRGTVQEIRTAFTQEFADSVPVAPPARRPRTKVPGRVAGVLLTVFGGIGLGLTLLAALVTGLIALVQPLPELTGMLLGLYLPLLAVDGILLGTGARLRHRTRRYRLYREEIGTASFIPVALLASHSGRSERFVRRDLRRMIRAGLFPEAHLDDTGETLMLDDETYRRYLEAKQQGPKTPADPQDDALASGRAILAEIHACNVALPGAFITEKLDRLEAVAEAILQYVEEHTEKLPQIRRFLSYYLPTTLKLLTSYQQFNSHPVPTRQQTKAKAEIEEALDTIHQAFSNLLDSLMQEDRMDVSADISVMRSIMEQEGLAGRKPGSPEQPGE